jgi:hypothetical protein
VYDFNKGMFASCLLPTTICQALSSEIAVPI